MNILSFQQVVKEYGSYRAVNDVTFDVPKASIFGMLGPNGAGKTSLIRIITGITAADSGTILLDGQKINANLPLRIGYMPEERGLYKKMKVGEQLMYLAQLKGLDEKTAKAKLRAWIDKFDVGSWWNKKIEELSKGMQQKVQFIATVVHDPTLLILDEPFSGLDPINANLIKDEIYELNKKGTSIIFSTHRMEQVEEICNEIALINKGKLILNGRVDEIKNQFKENRFNIGFKGNFPTDLVQDNFKVIEDKEDKVVIEISEGHNSNELLKALIDKNIQITSYHEILPTLNEIFIKKVGQSNE